jgi:aminoglycoside 6'-N-acetyltransferase
MVRETDEPLTFRSLEEDDLPLMHRWLNNEHVAEWYYVRDVPHPSLEWVRERYLPRIRGDDPTRAFVIVLGGREVGYIQAYFIDDNPDYAGVVQVAPGSVGVDVFIGEEDAVHRGLGSRIVQEFVDLIVFDEMDAEACVMGPEPDNRIAIRAYEKAGFRHLKTVRIPGGDTEYEYLMILERPPETEGGGQ